MILRKTITDLGLDLVLQNISALSLSEEGRNAVRNAVPIADPQVWRKRQEEVSQAVSALTEAADKELYVSAFPDIRPVFQALLADPSARLDGPLIYSVAEYIQSARALRCVLTCVPGAPEEVISPLDYVLTDLENTIFSILESPGRVRENYPTVRALRDKAEQKRAERSQFASSYMSSNSALMNSDSPVLRDGRVVLPVNNDSKSRVDGYVQGMSQTGATVFMEPFRLVDMNNAVNLANQEIEIEIARLLAKLSSMIREAEQSLRILSSQVAFADFLYTFATWIRQSSCSRVLEAEDCVCNLIKARHPLLKEKCVPIDFKVEQGTKAVVLTGPNAGGKTVTMNTVGLFSLLNQICGYVPASDGSSLAIFDRVFTDMGDDQSIENSLSTFSGHLRNIGSVLRNLTERSLVILDELGSGTDPQEGAALARSVLEFCTKKAMLTLTTSHHGVLKQYAYSSKSVQNASMEFDEKTLEPTFRVISGLPGESHAIDTAFRMHLPKSVVYNARKYMGKEAVRISSIIRSLEQKEREADLERQEIDLRLREIKNREKELEAEERRLKAYENRVRKDELRDFDDYVSASRRRLEELVKELREGEITREKTLKVKQHILELEKQRKGIETDIEQREKELDAMDEAELQALAGNVELKEGMDVLCGPYRREGVIVRKEKDGRWQVAIGQLRFTFKESEITVPVNRAYKAAVLYDAGTVKSVMPKPTIDVRGFRLEEALEEIDNQIEACCVHGLDNFSIIHGYGNGILSTGIHAHLKTHGAVQSYFFAHPEDGGQGKTYVRLRG